MVEERQDSDAELVPIAEAAARLGISPEATRKRIQRGTLPGRKVAGAWYVDAKAVPAEPAGPLATPPSGRPDAVPTSLAGRPDDADGTVQPRPDTTPPVVELEAVAVLRDLLAEERERADRYMTAAALWQERARGFEERLLQLSAGDPPPPKDAVVTRQDAPGAMNAPATGQEARGVLRRLWGRLVGQG